MPVHAMLIDSGTLPRLKKARSALPPAEPQTEKTAGLPQAVFSIRGIAHTQAAAGRATRAESIG